jgi:hypothetical protein
MFRSLVNACEVVADGLLHMYPLFEDFHLAIVVAAFDLGHDRVTSFDPHEPVGESVELLHLPFPQQCREVVQVFGGIDLPCYLQVLLLFVDLVLGPVPDANSTSSCPFFVPPLLLLDLLAHGVVADVVVRRLVDDSL